MKEKPMKIVNKNKKTACNLPKSAKTDVRFHEPVLKTFAKPLHHTGPLRQHSSECQRQDEVRFRNKRDMVRWT